MQKKFLYEVDPLFFYDSNNDGFGDFEGFLNKIDYFNFLNVDGIIFPDMFNQEHAILKKVDLSIFDKYGKLKSLKDIISTLKNLNKDLYVDINVKKILNTMIIKKTLDDFKSANILKYISEENVDVNEDVKWNTKARADAFEKTVDFWRRLGVTNFIFSDIEFLNKNSSKLSDKQIKQLNYFYFKTKEIAPNSKIGIRTFSIDSKGINTIFKKYIGTICDFVIDSSYSLVATHKNYPFDIMKNFKQKVLFNKIKKIKIKDELRASYFISLNNNQIGRVNSRWFDNDSMIDESNKSLLMLSNLLPYSTVNYLGDEIGLLRLNINHKSDYQDFEFVEKKRKLGSVEFKNYNFEKSQIYLSKINSQSIFIWENNKKGGFTEGDYMFRKLPINYQTHNLKDQYNDEKSIVNFYRKIVDFSRNNLEINKYKFSLYNTNNKLIIKYKSKNSSNLIFINLSSKPASIKIKKSWNYVLGSFSNKSYLNKNIFICPYESIIFENKKSS